MRVVRLRAPGGPEQLAIEEVDQPRPGPLEARPRARGGDHPRRAGMAGRPPARRRRAHADPRCRGRRRRVRCAARPRARRARDRDRIGGEPGIGPQARRTPGHRRSDALRGRGRTRRRRVRHRRRRAIAPVPHGAARRRATGIGGGGAARSRRVLHRRAESTSSGRSRGWQMSASCSPRPSRSSRSRRRARRSRAAWSRTGGTGLY
jgi:hypothetical protein